MPELRFYAKYLETCGTMEKRKHGKEKKEPK